MGNTSSLLPLHSKSSRSSNLGFIYLFKINQAHRKRSEQISDRLFPSSLPLVTDRARLGLMSRLNVSCRFKAMLLGREELKT